MIVLNRLAKKVLENAILSDRVTPVSGPRMYLLQALVHLNRVFDNTKFAHLDLPQWSEYEVGAADTICWLVAFLEMLGCKNIEQLMRDVIEYRSTHPDTPKRKND